MKGVRSAVLLTLGLMATSVRGQDYAQFADTWSIPTASLIQSGTVHWDTGTPLNPGGASFFDMFITNSGAWTLPDMSHPIPGYPVASTLSPVMIHPSYAALYSTTDLDAMIFRATAGSVVSFTFDFSSLPGGVLPAGAALAWGDIDQGEAVTLFSSTPGWTSGAIVFGDLTTGSPIEPSQPSPTPADFPAVSLFGDTISVTGAVAATDTVGVFIPITTPIASLTVVATDSADPFAQLFAVAFPLIPEPSTFAMVFMTGALAMMRRRRVI